MPGYFDEDWYLKNNRVKKISIFLDDYDITAELTDGMEVREIKLDDKIKFRRAEFIIKEIYKGTQFDDTCIAEIEFYHSGRPITLNPMEETDEEYPENHPANKYYMEPGTANFYYYFFPEGDYVTFTSSDLSSFEFPPWRRIGSWTYDPDTGIIDIHEIYACNVNRDGGCFAVWGEYEPEYYKMMINGELPDNIEYIEAGG